jgi:glycosyltransferase involved in cell wall biosynthesis
MKVIHIINSLSVGGAEKLLLDTIPLYNKKGIVADVLVFKSDNSVFLRELKTLGCCKVIELNQKSVYNPIIIFKLLKVLKLYDIAHVHLFPAQYFVPIAKLISFSNIKLIFTEHNTTNRRLSNKLFKIIDKISYRFYNKIVCITEEIEGILSDHIDNSSRKTVVIENGIDLKKIRKAVPLKDIGDIEFNFGDKLLLQVSAFRNQKDQATLIKSLSYLPNNFKVLLVGDGPNRLKCLDLSKRLNLQERVFFLGIRSDVPSLLKTVDVIVLSSKYEGLSLSSVEAMASGKPFLASNVPGLIDVVKGAGVLFELGNSKQLANKVVKLLETESYYNKIVSTCLERAEKYDVYNMVNRHLKLYNEV